MNEIVCNIDVNKGLEEIFRKFVRISNLTTAKPKTYVDIKTATTDPKILKLIVNNIIKKMIADKIAVNYIACLESGNILIPGLLSVETGLPLIISRKREFWQFIGNFKKGQTALFVEDITTTGISVTEAIKNLRTLGLIIDKIITVLDREEGADVIFAKAHIEFIQLTKLSDFKRKEPIKLEWEWQPLKDGVSKEWKLKNEDKVIGSVTATRGSLIVSKSEKSGKEEYWWKVVAECEMTDYKEIQENVDESILEIMIVNMKDFIQKGVEDL